MKFDKKERYIISNQLLILEKLYPEDAKFYSERREAIEQGYEDECEAAMEHIYDPLTSDIQTEVIDALDMYSAIKRSYDQLDNKTGLDLPQLLFPGFDGNDPLESKMMGYAEYLVKTKRKFENVLEGQQPHFSFNSHSEQREIYAGMLKVWKALPGAERYNMSREQITKVKEAGYYANRT